MENEKNLGQEEQPLLSYNPRTKRWRIRKKDYKIEIQNEKAFWDDVRLTIWHACRQYLNNSCAVQIQRSVIKGLHRYIKSDEVLLREVESGTPTSDELEIEEKYACYCEAPWVGVEQRLTSTKARIGEQKPDHKTVYAPYRA